MRSITKMKSTNKLTMKKVSFRAAIRVNNGSVLEIKFSLLQYMEASPDGEGLLSGMRWIYRDSIESIRGPPFRIL